MTEYKRGEGPADWEAAARVQSHPAKRALKGLGDTIREMEANPELAEVVDAMNEDLKAKGLLSPVDENVLEIKVTRFCAGKYHAYYVGEKTQGEGSTPYMAVRALIDAFNTTDVWNGRYGFD